MTETLMAVDLPAIDVESSRAFWPRTETGLNNKRVAELAQHIDDELSTTNTARGDTFAEGLAIFDPIVLVPDSTGRTYLIADGHHRIAAYQSREKAIQAATGWKHVVIRAQVLPTGSDVFVEATRRAIVTATPLKPNEKKVAVLRIAEEHTSQGQKPNHSEVARLAGVSRPFVIKVLKSVNVDSPQGQRKAPPPRSEADAIMPILAAMVMAENETNWAWGARARATKEGIGRYGDDRQASALIKQWAKEILDGAKSYRPQR